MLTPVTGRVERVARYRLYGVFPDVSITLIPFGRPDLRVVVLHVADAQVRRGDRLVAGLTPLATPRVLPFDSQVNDYVGAGIPHVHIEVKRSGPAGSTTKLV